MGIKYRLQNTLFLISFFYTFGLTSQISDHLYKILPENIKPVNPKQMTLEEKRQILRQAYSYSWKEDSTVNIELDKIAAELKAQISKTNDNTLRVLNNVALGDYYYYFKERENTNGLWVPYCEEVIKYGSLDTTFKTEVAYARLAIGVYRTQRSRYEEAAEMYHKSLDFFTKENDTTGISAAHTYLYSLYFSLNLFSLAIEEQNLMLSFMTAEEKRNGLADYYKEENYQDMAFTYLSWYEASGRKELMDSAEFYINKIRSTGEHVDKWLSYSYFLKGYYSFLNNRYQEAVTNFDSSLTIEDYYAETKMQKLVYKGISLLKLGRRNEGKEILLTKINTRADYNLAAISYKALYTDALENKDNENAIKYLLSAIKYKDSADVIVQRGKIFEISQRHSLAEKELEIVNLELINANRNKQGQTLLLVFVIVGVGLIAAIIGLYSYGRDRKIKAMEAKAELNKERSNLEYMMRLQQREIERERKKAVANLRQKISRDMHDELSSALTGLKYYVNDLRLKSENADEKELLGSIEQEVESVYVQARAYMHNLYTGIEEVVGNLNPFLQRVFQDLSRKKDLEIKLIYDKEEVESKLSLTQQNQLTLMLKEAMTNILKHSGANKIDIAISFRENACHFSISDNGKGFEKETLEKGLGIESIQARIKRIKGDLFIQSSPAGTRLEGNFSLSYTG